MGMCSVVRTQMCVEVVYVYCIVDWGVWVWVERVTLKLAKMAVYERATTNNVCVSAATLTHPLPLFICIMKRHQVLWLAFGAICSVYIARTYKV